MAADARRRVSLEHGQSSRSWPKATRSPVSAASTRSTARKILHADAYVMALGSYSPFLLEPLRCSVPHLPGQGLFGDDRHRRASRRADRFADRPCVEDRVHAPGRPAARRRHRRAFRLRQGPEPRALRGARQAHLRPLPRCRRPRQRPVLDGPATGHAVQCAAGGRHALSQSVPRHRPRHAGLDHGVRVRPRARRRDRRPQAWRGICILRVRRNIGPGRAHRHWTA